MKHEGGWRLHQHQPGHFTWTSRLGQRYDVHPPPIIEPLPDPILEDEPERPPEPESPPEPDQADDIPPF